MGKILGLPSPVTLDTIWEALKESGKERIHDLLRTWAGAFASDEIWLNALGLLFPNKDLTVEAARYPAGNRLYTDIKACAPLVTGISVWWREGILPAAELLAAQDGIGSGYTYSDLDILIEECWAVIEMNRRLGADSRDTYLRFAQEIPVLVRGIFASEAVRFLRDSFPQVVPKLSRLELLEAKPIPISALMYLQKELGLTFSELADITLGELIDLCDIEWATDRPDIPLRRVVSVGWDLLRKNLQAECEAESGNLKIVNIPKRCLWRRPCTLIQIQL